MKRRHHIQTIINGDREFLETLVKRYQNSQYEVSIKKGMAGPLDNRNFYTVKLADDCEMILHEADPYIDDSGNKIPLIAQVIYKLEEEK